MIEFKPAPNTPRPLDLVEVWLDGKMVAVISPHGEAGIMVKSHHCSMHEASEEPPDDLLQYRFQFYLPR